MTKVDLVYFNAGGGHRAAATALSTQLRITHPDWEIRCVNFTEIFEGKIVGTGFEDFYNKLIQKGWTYGLSQGLKVVQGLIKFNHDKLVDILSEHWKQTKPDMVVSLIPNFNKPLFDSVSVALPSVPYVTILTDIADNPPHFWIENQEQHFICGSEKAVDQAKEQGIQDWQIHKVSGMLLRPDFYKPEIYNKEAEQTILGFDPKKPVGIVMFGGQGSSSMLAIAEKLSDTQLILMCGHNERLKDKLCKLQARSKHLVLGFTTSVDYYMSLGDFFIGKPGPGSLSEAIQRKLPVITFRNAATMPQELYNTEWVETKRLGKVIKSVKHIENVVLDIIYDLDFYKSNVQSLDNRAIFEVPDILEKILTDSSK